MLVFSTLGQWSWLLLVQTLQFTILQIIPSTLWELLPFREWQFHNINSIHLKRLPRMTIGDWVLDNQIPAKCQMTMVGPSIDVPQLLCLCYNKYSLLLHHRNILSLDILKCSTFMLSFFVLLPSLFGNWINEQE